MRRARRHTCFAGALALAACEPGTRAAARSSETPDSSAPQSSASSAPRTDTAPAIGPAESLAAEWKITPGHFGPISSQTSENDLRRLFGGAVVKPDSVHLGEGEFWPGTVLFPDDSLRRAEVTWRDTAGRRRPWYIRLAGARSVWHVNGHIRLGTTLRELERLNGKPFTMSGYGWDYGGRVMDWNGGALDRLLHQADSRIRFSLFPDSAGLETKAYSQISGDRPYSSALPALQQLNPDIWEIFLDFPGGTP